MPYNPTSTTRPTKADMLCDYILPSGAKIDIDGVLKAINDFRRDKDDFPEYFLDTETGNVCEIPSAEALEDLVEKIGKSDRYLAIDSFYDADYSGLFADMLKTMPRGFIPMADKKRANELLATKGWEESHDYVCAKNPDFKDIFDEEVYAFKLDYLEGYINNFPKGVIERKFIGCGNCEICQMMKNSLRTNSGSDTDFDLQHGLNMILGSGMRYIDDRVGDFSIKNKNNREKSLPLTESRKQPKQKLRIHPKRALQIKVSLKDSSPLIWRRFVIPDTYTFFDLHVAIQDAMGWIDYHLHKFARYGKKSRETNLIIEYPNPENEDWYGKFDEVHDETKTKVIDILAKEKDWIDYQYDFGDSWDHNVVLEKIMPIMPRIEYPYMVAGKNICPWEDSGGIWGFYEKINILKNKKHRDRKMIIEWLDDLGEIDLDSNVNIEKQIETICRLDDFNIDDVMWSDPDIILREYRMHTN